MNSVEIVWYLFPFSAGNGVVPYKTGNWCCCWCCRCCRCCWCCWCCCSWWWWQVATGGKQKKIGTSWSLATLQGVEPRAEKVRGQTVRTARHSVSVRGSSVSSVRKNFQLLRGAIELNQRNQRNEQVSYANEQLSYANEGTSGGSSRCPDLFTRLPCICISIFDQVVRHYAFIWSETIKASVCKFPPALICILPCVIYAAAATIDQCYVLDQSKFLLSTARRSTATRIPQRSQKMPWPHHFHRQ